MKSQTQNHKSILINNYYNLSHCPASDASIALMGLKSKNDTHALSNVFTCVSFKIITFYVYG